MYKPSTDYNPKQAQLRKIIFEYDKFDEAIKLCLSLHSFMHLSKTDNASKPTLADMVLSDLIQEDYCIMPTKKDVTIAWNIWHTTRIEDITMNFLVNNSPQVLNNKWLKRLGTKVTDTANAMTDFEIISFSKEIDSNVLWDYRNEVAYQSQKIVSNLQYEDLKRTFTSEQLQSIVEQGGLTQHADSIWLKDFWGKKNVAGILLLPLTRHHAGHLNDCLKLKKKIKK